MASQAGRKVFLLGVGCQKAGTTWLYDFLAGHPEAQVALPKEFHVFDAMLRPELFAEFHERTQRLAMEESGTLASRLLGRSSPPPSVATASMRVEMVSKPEKYVEFFRSIGGDSKLLGEITPSYAALSAEDFGFIKELLEPHFDLRIVLLLRDPVERAYSAVRHFRRVYSGRYPVALRGDDDALFKRLYDTPYIWERADYQRLMQNLDQVFAPDQVHVEFFERLFTPEAIERLCAFLGIAPLEADFGKRVNASGQADRLDQKLRQLARERYSAVYDYCEGRFGIELIGKLWRQTEVA